MKRVARLAALTVVVAFFTELQAARADSPTLTKLSAKTKACIECHKTDDPGIYQQWGSSKHYGANVGCYECHAAQEGEPDAFLHDDVWIATIVSPKDCAICHAQEAQEFADSHHSKGARILGSLDNVLAEVVEGNRGMVTPAFPGGSVRRQ